jgi:serine/threonine protein kinase
LETRCVNGVAYALVKLLGKGKGGYSYLAEREGTYYVLKQIHHEPCDYYQFGNKIQSEINDYKRLSDIGIKMPAMLDVDVENERILKEYIEGDTVYDLIRTDRMQDSYIAQVRQMCALLYPAHTNIDYFPTNFVVQDGVLVYIDYECNDYMEAWNFENWGIQYWSKTPAFLKYVEEHS